MKKLTSVFFMGLASALGILAVLTMFLPFVEVDGGVKSAADIFWSSGAGTMKGAWTSFVGFMLILVASIAVLVMALPVIQPTAKVEKIVLISALSAFVVGLVLVAITGVIYSSFNPNTVSYTVMYPGYYIFLVLVIVAIASNVRAIVLDW